MTFEKISFSDFLTHSLQSCRRHGRLLFLLALGFGLVLRLFSAPLEPFLIEISTILAGAAPSPEAGDAADIAAIASIKAHDLNDALQRALPSFLLYLFSLFSIQAILLPLFARRLKSLDPLEGGQKAFFNRSLSAFLVLFQASLFSLAVLIILSAAAQVLTVLFHHEGLFFMALAMAFSLYLYLVFQLVALQMISQKSYGHMISIQATFTMLRPYLKPLTLLALCCFGGSFFIGNFLAGFLSFLLPDILYKTIANMVVGVVLFGAIAILLAALERVKSR